MMSAGRHVDVYLKEIGTNCPNVLAMIAFKASDCALSGHVSRGLSSNF
jgi:hypothetical protein